MIAKLICLVWGHKTFSYVVHFKYPNQHAYWCGRCGHESSEEEDKREHEAMMLALRYHYPPNPYGRYR